MNASTLLAKPIAPGGALILDSGSGLGAGILTIPTDQRPGRRRPPTGP